MGVYRHAASFRSKCDSAKRLPVPLPASIGELHSTLQMLADYPFDAEHAARW